MIKLIKERLIGAIDSVTGITSILGSWQVCHNICLGIIALLSIFGIIVAGMPLLFLTKIAKPVWAIAFLLLILSIGLYFKKRHCISYKLILFNAGLITAGIPFQGIQDFIWVFWILGGILVGISIGLFVKARINKE